MKELYILLTRTGTAFSRFVHLTTGDDYTHASLALRPDASRRYSFGRKRLHVPLPAGLVREDAAGGYMARHPETPCALYCLPVSDEVYARAERRLAEMLTEAEKYRYSLLGTALCRLDIAHERGYHYFCSQFVGELLEKSGALTLPKPASLLRPSDYAAMDVLQLVYTGTLGGLRDAGGVCVEGGGPDAAERASSF